MSCTSPLISVALITYNHEQLIAESIRSVLEQTFDNLELVVVDDGSTDGTPDVIASFEDPRLVSIRQQNAGPPAAWNRAIAACRGRYIAIMSGDDVCHLDRLRAQLEEYVKGGPRVLFSAVEFIDEIGSSFPRGHFLENAYDLRPRSRGQVLRRLFFQGNYLNLITCFTEAEVLRSTPGPFNPLLYQIQDFDLWIRLAKRYDFCFLPQPLVRYRIRSDHQNLSSHTPEHLIRGDNEYYFIMRHFFDGVSANLFHEAFAQEMIRPSCSSAVEIACEQAFLFLRSPRPSQQMIGLERLHALLSEPESAQTLLGSYGFTHTQFAKLLRDYDLFGLFGPQTTTLYIDAGEGFTESQVCRQTVFPLQRSFSITFDLSSYPGVRRVRWDPMELHHCRIWLDEVATLDSTGRLESSCAESIVANGVRAADGSYVFDTPDPFFQFPVDGQQMTLSLRGRWEALDHRCSFEQTHAQLVSVRQKMQALCGETSTLYVDTGLGFNEDEARRHTVDPFQRAFSLTFDLTAFSPIRRLRWDPFEMLHGRIWLEEICWKNRSGAIMNINSCALECNGTRDSDGSFVFETFDPMFLIPIEGDAVEVCLRGRWESLELRTSIKKTYEQCFIARQQLVARDRQMLELTQRSLELESELNKIKRSLLWRMTKPARLMLKRVKKALAS